MNHSESKSAVTFEDIFRVGSDKEQTHPLPFEDRSGTVTVFGTSDMILSDTRMKTDKPTQSWKHFNPQPFVELNFMIMGNLYQSHSGLLRRQLYTKGYHNWLFNPHSLEENELVDKGEYRNVSLNILPQKMITLLTTYVPELQSIAEKIEQGIPFVFHAPDNHLSHRMSYLLDMMWNSPQPAGLKKLYFESITLEMICQQVETLIVDGHRSQLTLHHTDHDKLYNAKSILQQRLSNPPSLAELARLSEMNEFSLKRGFRQLFGVSVFGYVQSQRLDKAKHLIYGGGRTISEIAYELGYAHPQHFHRAFKKQFGITPKQLVN